VVNSIAAPALTPAFPIIATHRGYRWSASWIRSNAIVASSMERPPLDPFLQLAHLAYLAVSMSSGCTTLMQVIGGAPRAG
jgi:hypothetical protein